MDVSKAFQHATGHGLGEPFIIVNHFRFMRHVYGALDEGRREVQRTLDKKVGLFPLWFRHLYH